MNKEHIIEMDGVTVLYRISKQKRLSLKEYAIHWIRGSLTHQELRALDNVSLIIAPGESVGIVGRNGAGKSTLLKTISRVLKPTSGTVSINGSIAPILELGLGFDPELTGLENILLSGQLLGHSRQSIRQRLPEIVAFSGLGDFVRAPIRNYSSGMQARLGFSIATAWTPDLLILDEVLAVGDAQFIGACNRRLREFHENKTTLLLVSHSPEAIRENCERAIWIEAGQVLGDGPTEVVLEAYSSFIADQVSNPAPESVQDWANS